MVIKAKRIYEPKKEDNFDIQKVLWEAIQKNISSSTDQTKQLVSEFERMSSDAWVKKLEEKFYQYIKNLRIEKEEIKQDIYKSIENWVNEIGRRVENHEHKEYLTQEDKDECINSARDMVNEAVANFDNLFKPFLEQLNTKSDKEHTHIEFEELKKEIEENEEELEQAIEMKADKEHKHEIEDITWLTSTLKDFAKKDHKHDEYATREELDFINRRRSGWGWSHVIQENWVVANQRGNINFIGATVTDDPDNNATVVTVTWWWGWASSYEVTQTWHWFVDLDWLYFDETDDTYKKAQSNSVDTLWAWHVVEVVDANTFKIAKDWVHEITNTLDLWEYVLSSTVAWWYTQTVPWDLWDLILYWMEVVSWTEVSFYTVPAITVGSEVEWVWTTNEIAYWIDANTLWALETATYPNLTELSYSKWVTSSIQTQLNWKEPTKWSDDNYVTDAQLVVIGNTSWTNTWDQDLSWLLPKAWWTMSGDIVLWENTSLQLDWVLSADGKRSWTTITATAWYTQAFWDLVYLDPTDSRREATDANAAAWADWDCRGAIWMVVVAWTDGNACTILLQGTIRADANFPTFTIGWPIFASETAWDVTQTAPTTSGNVVKALWWALTADSMYFNPSANFTVVT